MTTNRAIRVHELGGPEVLRLDEVELAAPGPGEARVRHTAIGINFIDTYHRTGLYPLPQLPHGIGQEAAGVVEALGEGVSGLQVGDRVAYATAGGAGAYCTLRNLPADRLVPIPEGVTDEAAAAMLLKGMTVEMLVRRVYPVRPGQTVLLHAAAGGVGLIACQWLAHLGATVIGTVSTPDKAALAAEHGCHHPIVYTEEDFVQRVQQITEGAGVPVVFDSVGKTTFMKSLECLQPRGMFVGFGNASGKPEPFDLGVLAQKGSLFLTRPTLFTYIATAEELRASASALFELAAAGAISVPVRQRWPLADAAQAHRALEARATVGASILVP